MRSNFPLSCLVVFCLFMVFSLKGMAGGSITMAQESDKLFINVSDVVAEGEVRNILYNDAYKKGYCFLTIYELGVENLIKGNVSNKKSIYVGLTRRFPLLQKGQKQLVLLAAIDPTFYNYCSFDFKAIGVDPNSIFVDSSQFASVYVQPKKDSDGNFTSAICEDDMKILGSDSGIFIEKYTGAEGESCQFFHGSYSGLKELIRSEVEN